MTKITKFSMLFAMLLFISVALFGCTVDLSKKEELLEDEDYIVIKYDDEEELKGYQDEDNEYVVVGVLMATKITESGIIINLESASQAKKYMDEIEDEDYEYVTRKGSSIIAATNEDLFNLLKK